MDSTSYLASVRSIAASCFGIVLCIYLGHISAFILFTACTLNDICGFESYFISWIKSVVALYLFFYEVLSLDIAFTAECDDPLSVLFAVRVVFYLKFFCFSFGIVCYNELYRTQYDHYSLCCFVEVFSKAMLKKTVIYNAVCLCNAYPVTEIAYRCGCIASSSESAESGHSWVIPAVYYFVLN